MSSRGPFRAATSAEDACEDWPLIHLPDSGDGVSGWVCTDHVHASEVSELVPASSVALARLVADALNAYHAANRERWGAIVRAAETWREA